MKTQLLAAVALVMLTACGGGSEAEPLAPAQARGYFSNIDTLLDETVAAHAQGDTDQAAELAGQAYLENFEYLEHDLEEKDHDLNERLESLLGAPLRQAIKKGMTQDALESRVDEIRGLLGQARTALGVA